MAALGGDSPDNGCDCRASLHLNKLYTFTSRSVKWNNSSVSVVFWGRSLWTVWKLKWQIVVFLSVMADAIKEKKLIAITTDRIDGCYFTLWLPLAVASLSVHLSIGVFPWADEWLRREDRERLKETVHALEIHFLENSCTNVSSHTHYTYIYITFKIYMDILPLWQWRICKKIYFCPSNQVIQSNVLGK